MTNRDVAVNLNNPEDLSRPVESYASNSFGDGPGAQWNFSKRAWIAQVGLSACSSLSLLIIMIIFAYIAVGMSNLQSYAEDLIAKSNRVPAPPP